MMELLAPAGSMEAVAAAVQNGRTPSISDMETLTPAAGHGILLGRRLRRRFLTAISGAARSILR